MNQQINQPGTGTVAGTAMVLLVQISSAEIFKTIILAAVGAVVSFIVSFMVKAFIKKLRK